MKRGESRSMSRGCRNCWGRASATEAEVSGRPGRNGENRRIDPPARGSMEAQVRELTKKSPARRGAKSYPRLAYEAQASTCQPTRRRQYNALNGSPVECVASGGECPRASSPDFALTRSGACLSFAEIN